jgi:hypothetical protein
MDTPQLDPMGAIVTEARAAPDLAALVGTDARGKVRVRGSEPGPGDEKGVGEFQAFVVISTLSAPPMIRTPATVAEYSVRCYGATFQNAWAVWGAFVAAFHEIGPRLKASGLGIYRTDVITGGSEDRDPDTNQPVVTGSIRLIATTQVVTA